MSDNPMDAEYQDEVIDTLTIKCKLTIRPTSSGLRVSGPSWLVEIPEIHFKQHTKNLTKTLAMKLAEIEEGNEEVVLGEAAYYKDPTKMHDVVRAAKGSQLHTAHDKVQEGKLPDAWERYRSHLECDTQPVDRSQSINYPTI